MHEKIILYLGGGAMSGVYGAGVLKKIHDLHLVNRIEAIYSGSVGTPNAAYLLSGQAELGPTIYFEELQDRFLFPKNILFGTFDLLKNRWWGKVHKEYARNVVDINYVYKILKFIKPLDVRSLSESPVDLFIKVLNVDSGSVKYIRFQDYPHLELIKAAVTLKPYFFEEVALEDGNYIDGTIKEPIGLSYLSEKYPNHKIVVILNEPIERGIRHYLKNILEGIISSLYPYRVSMFRLFMQRERSLRRDIEIAIRNTNVLLLHPNFEGRARPRTTKPEVLKQTFDMGYIDAEKLRELF